MIPVVSFAAFSGTGKTTLLEKLLPELKKRGIRTAVVKHDGHDFEIDREGTDSCRLTKAGADVTVLVSDNKSVIMENRSRSVQEIISKITDVDLIITEGFKNGPWPKIMLYRPETGKGMPLDPSQCEAVVCDVPVKGARRQLAFNEIEKMADFLEDFT